MEPQDLSELVALYALGILPETERALVEGQPIQPELAQLETAVAALAYSAPAEPIASDLKDRLIQRIGSLDQPVQQSIVRPVTPAALATLKQQSETVQWETYPFAAETTLGMLWLDQQTRQGQCFVRATGATLFPLHRHQQPEEIVVVEGDLEIDGQVYYQGSQILSEAGTQHQPRTRSGCLIAICFSLDDEILEPDTIEKY
jgi:hypothetical protein